MLHGQTLSSGDARITIKYALTQPVDWVENGAERRFLSEVITPAAQPIGGNMNLLDTA